MGHMPADLASLPGHAAAFILFLGICGVPAACERRASAEKEGATSLQVGAMSFDGLGLDARLLRALNKLGLAKPTPVQVSLHTVLPRAFFPWSRRCCVRLAWLSFGWGVATGQGRVPPSRTPGLAGLPCGHGPVKAGGLSACQCSAGRVQAENTESALPHPAPSKPFPCSPQAAAIPPALAGGDIVARARTGSGKTLAYLLPALHRILESGDPGAAWQVVVLVPTRELCRQVAAEASRVGKAASQDLAVTSLAGEGSSRAASARAGAVVVATPARLAEALAEAEPDAATLAAGWRSLVLDEADLLLAYGYADDMKTIAGNVRCLGGGEGERGRLG